MGVDRVYRHTRDASGLAGGQHAAFGNVPEQAQFLPRHAVGRIIVRFKPSPSRLTLLSTGLLHQMLSSSPESCAGFSGASAFFAGGGVVVGGAPLLGVADFAGGAV